MMSMLHQCTAGIESQKIPAKHWLRPIDNHQVCLNMLCECIMNLLPLHCGWRGRHDCLQKMPRKQTALSLSLFLSLSLSLSIYLSISISISIYLSIYLSISIFISISFLSFSLTHTRTFSLFSLSLSLSEHTNGALGFPIFGCPVVVSPIHCSFTKGENWTMHFQPSINLLQEVLVTDWLIANINVVLLIIPPWTDMSSSPHVYIDWQQVEVSQRVVFLTCRESFTLHEKSQHIKMQLGLKVSWD